MCCEDGSHSPSSALAQGCPLAIVSQLLCTGAWYPHVSQPLSCLNTPMGPFWLSLTWCLGCAVQHLLLGARQGWQEPRGSAGSAEGERKQPSGNPGVHMRAHVMQAVLEVSP